MSAVSASKAAATVRPVETPDLTVREAAMPDIHNIINAYFRGTATWPQVDRLLIWLRDRPAHFEEFAQIGMQSECGLSISVPLDSDE